MCSVLVGSELNPRFQDQFHVSEMLAGQLLKVSLGSSVVYFFVFTPDTKYTYVTFSWTL
jgi:hypothetical protein